MLQMTTRTGRSAEYLVVYFVSNEHLKENFCNILPTYHYNADNIALLQFLGTCGLNKLYSYATHQ